MFERMFEELRHLTRTREGRRLVLGLFECQGVLASALRVRTHSMFRAGERSYWMEFRGCAKGGKICVEHSYFATSVGNIPMGALMCVVMEGDTSSLDAWLLWLTMELRKN